MKKRRILYASPAAHLESLPIAKWKKKLVTERLINEAIATRAVLRPARSMDGLFELVGGRDGQGPLEDCRELTDYALRVAGLSCYFSLGHARWWRRDGESGLWTCEICHPDEPSPAPAKPTRKGRAAP